MEGVEEMPIIGWEVRVHHSTAIRTLIESETSTQFTGPLKRDACFRNKFPLVNLDGTSVKVFVCLLFGYYLNPNFKRMNFENVGPYRHAWRSHRLKMRPFLNMNFLGFHSFFISLRRWTCWKRVSRVLNTDRFCYFVKSFKDSESHIFLL